MSQPEDINTLERGPGTGTVQEQPPFGSHTTVTITFYR